VEVTNKGKHDTAINRKSFILLANLSGAPLLSGGLIALLINVSTRQKSCLGETATTYFAAAFIDEQEKGLKPLTPGRQCGRGHVGLGR